jgi:hypothetical protein
MFILIEKHKERRSPQESDVVFKDPKIGDYEGWATVEGEKIPRQPQWKLTVKLRHTWRDEGRVKGKSMQVAVISYWDFIDHYIDDLIDGYEAFSLKDAHLENLYNACQRMKETGFKVDHEALEQQFKDKIAPWYDKALEQYKQSEEYGFVHECAGLWEECILIRRDHFARKQKKREDQTRQEQEQWEQRSSQSRQSNPGLTGAEQEMFKEFVKVGFRSMSKLHHPDKQGGDDEQMKVLNNLKEKLDLLV